VSTQASTTLIREQFGIVHRAARWAAILCMLAAALPAAARVHHNDAWARAQFAKAERTREALNGRPAGERTRREYQRAIDAYRRVYFGSPASSKADPSVVATAELMVEMGRRFNDNKILRGAIEEYRFLRKEYPGSKYRFEALFTIGEIYKDDLNNSEEAKKAFEDFLHRYPRNRLADDARAAMKEMDDLAAEAQRAPRKGKKAGKSTAVAEKDLSVSPSRTLKTAATERNDAAKEESTDSDSSSNAISDVANTDAISDSTAAPARRGELPRVTGVRHWSTPDYTRVAIDVERDVKFDSQRISNPDRIFFDLKDTKLASTLVGKSFDVDDGFLKKIRVAEFKPGRTRVVLEVDDLSSYDAFLLPNPYRLIIDIHGKESRATLLAKAQHTNVPESATSSSTEDAEEVATDLTVEHRGQKKSEKEHAIVAKVKPESVEDDDQAAPTPEGSTDKEIAKNDAETNASNESNNKESSVVKTTVAVKGSNRKIPKTIVKADDDETSSASAAGAKKHGQTSRNDSVLMKKPPASTAADDGSDDGIVEEAKAVPPDVPGARHPSAPRSKTSSTSLRKKKSRSAGDTDNLAELEMREAQPTASGDRSLTRALGLKIGKIVIDAGHGGHDTGTIGPNGLLEKDLVLDVARRLGRLLEARLGAEVVYTRRDDTFVPLETRTAIANREQADLFISVHANSSRDPDARGVETYYLNFTSSPEALEVAARENAVSEKSVHELQDLVKKIALKEKIDESREFASDVQDSLYGGLALRNAGVRNRGVKKAPFIVLIGANMPSILAEISFVSNPTDERKLEGSEQRQRIAESLYRGVAKYAGGLSGVKVASRIDKTQGQ